MFGNLIMCTVKMDLRVNTSYKRVTARTYQNFDKNHLNR